MDFITTDDRSLTFRNNELHELYHTKAGAIVEALEKHARALNVWEKNNPILFDVCSGLSYNAACAVEEIRNHDNNSLITVYLFENDLSVLKANLELPDNLNYVQDGEKKTITCFVHFKNAILLILLRYSSVNRYVCHMTFFGSFFQTALRCSPEYFFTVFSIMSTVSNVGLLLKSISFIKLLYIN